MKTVNINNKKKDAIIEAAKTIVAQQGFNRLTYREVAREAKISPGTLYYYYNSKEELLYDIMDSTTRRLRGLSDAIEKGLVGDEDIPNKLFTGAIEHITNTNRNMVFLHVIHEFLSGDEELREKLADKYSSWIEDFEKIFRQKYNVPPHVSKALAIIYDAMIDGLLIKELVGLDPLNIPEVGNLMKLISKLDFKKISELVSSAKK